MYIIMFGKWSYMSLTKYHFFRIITKKGKLTPFVRVRKKYYRHGITPKEKEYIKNDVIAVKEALIHNNKEGLYGRL